jgi:hypothetical protein
VEGAGGRRGNAPSTHRTLDTIATEPMGMHMARGKNEPCRPVISHPCPAFDNEVDGVEQRTAGRKGASTSAASNLRST